jgi:integrase
MILISLPTRYLYITQHHPDPKIITPNSDIMPRNTCPKNCMLRGSTYHFKKYYKGNWYTATLETKDYDIAAAKAATLRRHLTGSTWHNRRIEERSYDAVEHLFLAFDAYFESSDLEPRTANGYKAAMLRILRKLYPERKSLKLPLSIFTPKFFDAYQKLVFRCHRSDDALARNTATKGSFSEIANAKGLFSQEALQSSEYERLMLNHASIRELKEWKPKRGKSSGFRAPAETVIQKMEIDLKVLKKTAPGRWLAAMLAANVGLRRSEAIVARREQFVESMINGTRSVAYVVDINDERGTKGSQGSVPVDWAVYQQILEVLDWPGYILPGHKTQREKYFRENANWLREIGWDRNRPNHELRKYFGAHLATKYDIYTAQRSLRHSSVQITSDLYSDILDNNRTVSVIPAA